jgi:hypothetical protein
VYEQCGVANVCCDSANGTCPYESRLRLLALLRRRGFI